MKKRKEINNQGFSLVELIVTIGIVSFLIVGFFVGFNILTNKSVEECAKKMQSKMENNRTTTMGKLNSSLKFYVSGGKIKVDETIDGNTTTSVVGDSSVVVTYDLKNGTDERNGVNLSSEPLIVSFDRASGSLNKSDGSRYLTYIKIAKSSGGKTITLKVDKLSGRISVE
ncbi:MAG: type II secretion system protein [Lachnospiraceae bacterium]|nr:type II secretion system protein [Lachnospiraceae bacterium]